MDDIKRYLEAEQKCVQLIAQFLLYNDFSNSLPVFIEEAVSLDYQLSNEELSEVDHIKREDVKKLINVFQSNDHTEFFKVWMELIPESIKNIFDYKKLTFYLHVHFAILPFRESEEYKFEELSSEDETNLKQKSGVENKVNNTPVKRLEVIEETSSPYLEYDTDSLDQSQVVIDNEKTVEEIDRKSRLEQHMTESENGNSQPSTGMEVLKTFLASEGETFSSQQEFLPFFALPYVTSPDKHVSFTALFQEKWLSSLNERFYEFIYQYSCGEVAPKIVKLCEEPALGTPNLRQNSTDSPSQSNAADTLRRYKQARRKFSKLHKDHQNLIGVAAELTQALENSVRGQAVDLRATLNKCSLIFPELFGSESFSRSSSPQRIKVPTVEPLKNPKVLCCSELDVYKIKTHLVSASMKTKLLLLQAIRWRMTRGTSEERDQVVMWLSRHDLLSVYTDMVKNMLQPVDAITPHPLQQAVSRLLNAVASLRAGRDYLTASDSFMTHLMACLKQESGARLDSVTSDMLLATLQKLSLRRHPRLLMIERSMVEWLVSQLSGETERLYTLEYSTALLLNLCLHVEGRERCPTSTLKLLTDLLDTGQLQIMPMVASTLYCLLSHDRLNTTARQMNLESVLTLQSQRYAEEPHILRQIQTLLKLLRGELPSDSVLPVSEEPSEDDLDDPETLETELDAEDPVRATGDDQSGEPLLVNQYRKIFPSHGIVCPHTKEPEIAILPSTPRSRPPTREK
ncbi:lisH domain-containing protein ARMC9-like [Macrosteles quadrilineatus]|uniref:lisH domain-containing protein ARMC9-like n=1 Tax=Macrosteles quadrilineatus TaxID=74068 RepID=UPI0023E13DD3|nr:lisH domain-containing protein ARMC9-like [Macrosteles quadrilineatus]